jgi:hypothetical protein
MDVVFEAVYPRPDGRPARKAGIGHEYMVAEQYRELPLLGRPVLVDPSAEAARIVPVTPPAKCPWKND